MSSDYRIPTLVDYQSVAGASSLSMLSPPNVDLTGMFVRYLLQKAISVFKWELPETWDKDYFLYVLYCWGHLAVVNTDRFGIIPQACGLMGYNVFYRPTNAIITNPLLTGILQPRIGVECTVIKLQPDYGGIMDLVNYYANMMAEASMAVGVNLANSKVAQVFFTDRKAIAESYKKAYDAVTNGQPMVVLGKDMARDDGSPAWEQWTRDVKQSYIVTDLLSDLRRIEAMYDTDIGIPNANTDKRERLITDEVNANNIETYSKCALWLEQLQASCEETRRMFGIELSVDWREIPIAEPAAAPASEEGGESDAAED